MVGVFFSEGWQKATQLPLDRGSLRSSSGLVSQHRESSFIKATLSLINEALPPARAYTTLIHKTGR